MGIVREKNCLLNESLSKDSSGKKEIVRSNDSYENLNNETTLFSILSITSVKEIEEVRMTSRMNLLVIYYTRIRKKKEMGRIGYEKVNCERVPSCSSHFSSRQQANSVRLEKLVATIECKASSRVECTLPFSLRLTINETRDASLRAKDTLCRRNSISLRNISRI